MSLITNEFNWADEVLGNKPALNVDDLKKALNIGSAEHPIKEMIASINKNKLYWGNPPSGTVTEVAPSEDHMENMRYCSLQMEKLAKTRGPIKTAWDTMQIKTWTKLRAEAAQRYLVSDRFQDMLEHIDALQWEIDGATSVGDKQECYRLISKIEPLRKEIARVEKWARDIEKLD
jgi:hypothetical protein